MRAVHGYTVPRGSQVSQYHEGIEQDTKLHAAGFSAQFL
jgi:hypothetical protein